MTEGVQCGEGKKEKGKREREREKAAFLSLLGFFFETTGYSRLGADKASNKTRYVTNFKMFNPATFKSPTFSYY